MRSFTNLLMPILRGRDHLDRRLAGLYPWHSTFLLLDTFQPELTDAENVARLRDAAVGAPKGVQRVLPVGPDHAVFRQAIRYAARLVGDGNYVVAHDDEVRDRHGVLLGGFTLDADAIDLWAEHLGVRLRAEGMYERTPAFLAYAKAVNLT